MIVEVTAVGLLVFSAIVATVSGMATGTVGSMVLGLLLHQICIVIIKHVIGPINVEVIDLFIGPRARYAARVVNYVISLNYQLIDMN